MAMFLATPGFSCRKKKNLKKSRKSHDESHRKNSSHAMQFVDHNTMCQFDEVPTNLQMKEIATEVPIRMNVVLPQCWVVLRRLTEEEIHQSYPEIYPNEEINDSYVNQTQSYSKIEGNCYNEHNYSQSAHLERKTKRKRLRDLSCNNDLFEIYKQKRRRFIDRRNGANLNTENNTFSHSNESETDMSEDEFKIPNGQIKGKKKIKRGKYERDSEWNPHTPKNTIPYGKRLRRQVRRPIIDSDSSSTDEEEILYQLYTAGDLSCDSNSTNSAFHNSVPSELEINEPIASSASPFTKISVHSNSLDSDKVINPVKSMNSSQGHNTKSVPVASPSLDIVAGIMKEMDNCKRVTGNLKSKTSGNTKTMPVINNIKSKNQQGRKRAKSSDNTGNKINTIVANVLQEMINTVSSKDKQEQQQQQQIDKTKKIKKCIWCHTQFFTSKTDETMCNICYDQGKGKYLTCSQNKSKPSKDKVSKLQKQVSGSKFKKVSTTMSRVLKNLPKNEMQRLMYTEKNNKLSNEKGYSHCKSFSTPKDVQEHTNITEQSQEGKNTEILNKTNQGRKKGVKKSASIKNRPSLKSDAVHSINSSNNKVESESAAQNSAKSESCSNKTDSQTNSLKKNKISLKKFNEGLFLMSFPEPDEELNMNIEHKQSFKSATKKGTDPESSKKLLNSNQAAKSSDKPVSPPKKPKNIQSTEKTFKTFLLPPVCTVIIANYVEDPEDDGNYHLTQIFYQNEYTHQHACREAVDMNDDDDSLELPEFSIVTPQNSPTNIVNNTSLTITTVPLISASNQTQPVLSNLSPLVKDSSVSSNGVTILPVVSSVVNLSEQASLLNEDKSLNFPADDKLVNSEQLSIKIISVSTCENDYEDNSDFVTKSENDKNANLETSNILKASEEVLSKENAIELFETSIKRKCSNFQKIMPKPKKKKNERENQSSDTDISDYDLGQEASKIKENVEGRIEKVNSIPPHENQNIVDKLDTNIPGSENISKLVDQSSNILEHSKSVSGLVKQNSDALKISDSNGQNSRVSEHSAQKPVETDENSSTPDPINSAIDLVGAIAILGVIDLERNPPYRLSYQKQIASEKLAKLINENNGTPEMNEKIALSRYNVKVFEIAQKYLNLYGSFAKVTEYLLRRHQMEQKIQIKKELIDEELDEEDTNQSSCRFSQRPQSANQLSNETFSYTSDMPSTSPLAVKMENMNSCRLSEKSSALSHIEKIQSQIAAMNNAQTNLEALSSGSTVHHYAAEQYAGYTPAAAVPAPVTPRNDCMGGESRETPSRGSGPRTPARPESATSQPDEQSLAIQVKREQFEATVSSPSQCAYTQNTTLTQITSHVPVMQDIPVLNTTGQTVLSNTLQQISVSGGTVNHVYTSSSSYGQPREIAISRAPPAYGTVKPSYTNVLLNLVPKPQAPPNVSAAINPNVDHTGQLLFGQQLYIQNGTGVPQKQAVPSVNNNQYLIQQPFSAPNNTGTVLVNTPQVSGQNVNALLTNVSNQQFYTNSSNQIPQLYYPPTSQIACTQTTMQAPNVTVSQNQGACYRKFVLRRICRYRDDHNIERNLYLINFPKKH